MRDVAVEVPVQVNGESVGRVVVTTGYLLVALDASGEPEAQGGAPTLQELIAAWGRSGAMRDGIAPWIGDAIDDALERAVAQAALATMPAPRVDVEESMRRALADIEGMRAAGTPRCACCGDTGEIMVSGHSIRCPRCGGRR